MDIEIIWKAILANPAALIAACAALVSAISSTKALKFSRMSAESASKAQDNSRLAERRRLRASVTMLANNILDEATRVRRRAQEAKNGWITLTQGVGIVRVSTKDQMTILIDERLERVNSAADSAAQYTEGKGMPQDSAIDYLYGVETGLSQSLYSVIAHRQDLEFEIRGIEKERDMINARMAAMYKS